MTSKAKLLSPASTPSAEPGVDAEVTVYANEGPQAKEGALQPVKPSPEPLEGDNPFAGAFYPEAGNRVEVAAGGPFAEGLKLLAKGVSPLAVDASREALAKQEQMLTRMGHVGPLPKYAANINLEKLEAPDQINGLIMDVATMLGEARTEEATRGVVSAAQTTENAHALFARDEGFMLGRNVGQAFNAEQVKSTRMVLASARDRTFQLEQQILAGDNGQSTQLAYLRSLSLNAAVQLQLNGMTAEAGRALQQFKQKVTGGSLSAESLDAMASKIDTSAARDAQAQLDSMGGLEGILDMIEKNRSLTTSAEKNAFARAVTRPGAGDMLREVWYGSALSGLQTQERNFLGNASALFMSTAEHAVAAKWGKLFGMVGMKQGVQEGEAAAMVSAYWGALHDSFKLFNFALRHNESVGSQVGYRMPMSLKEVWKSSPQEAQQIASGAEGTGAKLSTGRPPAITGPNVIASVKETASAVKSKLGIKDARTTADPASTGERGALGRMTDLMSLIIDGIGGTARASGRLLGAVDQFWKTLAYRGKAATELTREGINAGFRGKELRDYVDQGVNFLTPTQEAAAEKFARIVTMSEQLQGKFGRGMNLIGQSGAGVVIAPFVRVTANILDFSTQRVAFPVRPVWWRELFSEDLAERDLAMAKASTGALVWAAAFAAARSGYEEDDNAPIIITGSGPTGPAAKALWLERGYKPNSIRIGGKGGQWAQYSRLDPGGQILGIAADSVILMSLMDDLTAEEFGASLIAGIGNNVVNKSYMQSTADAMEVFTSYNPEQYQRWLQRQAGILVPNLVAQIVAEQDPYLRRAVTIGEELTKRSSVEGRKALPLIRSISGKPIKIEQYFGVSVADDKPDPVADELFRLEMSFSRPSKNLRGVELDEKQYDRYQQLVGYALKKPVGTQYFGVGFKDHTRVKLDLSGLGMWEALGELFKDKAYKRATDGADPPGQKVGMVSEVRQLYLEDAQAKMMSEFPDLVDKILEMGEKRGLADGADPVKMANTKMVRRESLQRLSDKAKSYEVVE
jgi:hypothetical protein